MHEKSYKLLVTNKCLITCNPFINAEWRLFPEMSPYSNYASYCLLATCKNHKQKVLFSQKKAKNPILLSSLSNTFVSFH